MMDFEAFKQLAARIRALGYDADTAADYAGRIGDTPELDEAGLTVVRDDQGAVVARLRLFNS